MTEQEILMSPTMAKLCSFAGSMPLDVHVKSQLQPAMIVCLLSLISALDNDRIQFTLDEDEAMLYGLLTLGLELSMDGGFRSGLRAAAVN